MDLNLSCTCGWKRCYWGGREGPGNQMVKSDTKENLDEAAVNLFYMIGTFSLEYNNGKQLTLCENVILSHGH